MKFESNVKTIPHSQGDVYGKLSDLNNLAGVMTKLNDPEVREKIKEHVPEEKLDSVQKYLDSLKLDSDSVSIAVEPIGELGFQIAESEPDKCIKFKSTKSPVVRSHGMT